MDVRSAKKILVVVKGLWGERFVVTPEAISAWRLVLHGQDPETIAVAALEHNRSGARFPPTPGELLALVKRGDVDRVPTAAEGWEDAMGALAAQPHDGPPECSFPVAQRTAEAIGWGDLADTAKRSYVRAHFLRMYQQFADAEASGATSDAIHKQLGGGRDGAGAIGDGLRKFLGDGK